MCLAMKALCSRRSISPPVERHNEATGAWTLQFNGQSGAQTVVLTQAQVQDEATWDPQARS